MSRLNRLIYAPVFSGWAWIPVAAQVVNIEQAGCPLTDTKVRSSILNVLTAHCNGRSTRTMKVRVKLVGATLEGACFGNRWNLSALVPGQEYGGPGSLVNSNICQCNTVVYSLISACGACQNTPFPPWTQWRKNCPNTNVTIAGFPHEIPPATSVPAWAYIDVTLPMNGNMWNKDVAQANATSNPPETSGGALPPKSISKTLISASGTDTTGIPSPTTVETSSKSKAGPIAGGVVGGVIGLAALALLAFILYRKSYRPKQSVLHVNEKVDIGGAASPAPTQGGVHARTPSGDQQFKLYNPSDPSTFPPSPFPTFTTQNAQTNPYGSLGKVAARSGASGYNGTPEV